jgi:hypothetical protein
MLLGQKLPHVATAPLSLTETTRQCCHYAALPVHRGAFPGHHVSRPLVKPQINTRLPITLGRYRYTYIALTGVVYWSPCGHT